MPGARPTTLPTSSLAQIAHVHPADRPAGIDLAPSSGTRPGPADTASPWGERVQDRMTRPWPRPHIKAIVAGDADHAQAARSGCRRGGPGDVSHIDPTGQAVECDHAPVSGALAGHVDAARRRCQHPDNRRLVGGKFPHVQDIIGAYAGYAGGLCGGHRNQQGQSDNQGPHNHLRQRRHCMWRDAGPSHCIAYRSKCQPPFRNGPTPTVRLVGLIAGALLAPGMSDLWTLVAPYVSEFGVRAMPVGLLWGMDAALDCGAFCGLIRRGGRSYGDRLFR